MTALTEGMKALIGGKGVLISAEIISLIVMSYRSFNRITI
jgi:hypothetical protein